MRVEHRSGYWFDHVSHLLHFPDATTEAAGRSLLGDVLARCPPKAYVECAAGTARYPLQLHLADLDADTRVACVEEFARASVTAPDEAPRNYEELLLATFGSALCELFFFPYNRKMWRRPLSQLASSGVHWNIARPGLADMIRGAIGVMTETEVYNANGWYPRPHSGAPVRGMEVLSRALAERVSDLRTGETVESIDLDRREVVVDTTSGARTLRFAHCLSTIPLPMAFEKCRQSPADLRDSVRDLRWNRVRSVLLSISGPRRRDSGHWRYIADESVPFTKLVYMTAFDPLMAPPDGWSLLVEVTERGEDRPEPDSTLVPSVLRGLTRLGALGEDCAVVDSCVLTIDPAYVVFMPENHTTIERARAVLRAGGVEPLGRYGYWEYSAMTKAMADGRAYAASIS